MPAVIPIRDIALPEIIPAPAGASRPAEFRNVVEEAIGGVERHRQQAARSVETFLAGEGGELHSTVLAAQRAELALGLFLEARNKVVQAYQEIMRMQI